MYVKKKKILIKHNDVNNKTHLLLEITWKGV